MSIQSPMSTAVGSVDDLETKRAGGTDGLITVQDSEQGKKGTGDGVGGEGHMKETNMNDRDVHPTKSVHVDTGILLLPKGKNVTRVMAHVPLGIVTQTAIYILRRRTLPLT